MLKFEQRVLVPCSAYESSMEALQQSSIRTIAVIAEGVPEGDTKQLIAYAAKHNKIILGPATVGGLQVMIVPTVVILILQVAWW